MKKDYFPQLISEICHEHNIKLDILQNGLIRILSLNGEERGIWSKKFEINSVIATKIADNKSCTYEILKHNKIPCVPHKRYTCHYENCVCYLDKISVNNICHDLDKYKELILKPENGYEGSDVYRCSHIEDLFQMLKKLQKPYSYLCSSPYYCIKAEYRTICLNGIPLLSYKKTLPFVTGDGKNTVLQLTNQKYGDIFPLLLISKKNYIPEIGEKVTIGWKFNLSQGAKSSPITNPTLLKKIQKLSLEAARSIHIEFASVDIIETISGDFLVLEINSGVVLNQFINDSPENYDLAKRIYREAILSMFAKSRDS